MLASSTDLFRSFVQIAVELLEEIASGETEFQRACSVFQTLSEQRRSFNLIMQGTEKLLVRFIF